MLLQFFGDKFLVVRDYSDTQHRAGKTLEGNSMKQQGQCCQEEDFVHVWRQDKGDQLCRVSSLFIEEQTACVNVDVERQDATKCL